jgi:hypothetical protein
MLGAGAAAGVAWFGWMLLSAAALAAWMVLQTLFGWWGLVAGFLVGGLFCLGMAAAVAWRAGADPGRRRARCAECGAAVPAGAAVCPRCRGPVSTPAARGRAGGAPAGPRAAPATGTDGRGAGDASLAGALSRATAPVAAQLSANYTWRNFAGVLLIFAGLTGALGATTVGWSAVVAALGVGGGLAVLRWMPGGD